MGMGTYIIGFIPPDEQWNKYKKVWDTCVEAGIEPPDEVIDFFEGEAPSKHGKEITLNWSNDSHIKESVKEWQEDMREGFEVDLTKLPKNIKVLRFYNSW